MNCCHHDCAQGRACALRAAIQAVQATEAAQASAAKTLHASQPVTSDGGAHIGPREMDELTDDTGLLIFQCLALVVFVVSMALYALL